MPAALRWKSKLILSKIETTYGVDPTPTAAMLATNVVCKPMEGQDVARNLERPFRGAQEVFPAGLHVILEYDIEMVGGGAAGTAPPYAALLRACGMSQTVSAGVSVVYAPVSVSYDSVAQYFYIGGTKQAILGCRGSAVFTINAQGIPVVRFTFTGLWAKPTDVAVPAADFSAFKTPKLATNANTPVMTIGGVSLVTKSFIFDLANDVQARLLIGREEIQIVDSDEEFTVEVEAVPLATFDPFDNANTLARVAVAVQQDTRAGYKVAIAGPVCTVRRPQEYKNDNGDLMWSLKLAPLPTDAGNDQFSITLT
jgi:hypothetical protein